MSLSGSLFQSHCWHHWDVQVGIYGPLARETESLGSNPKPFLPVLSQQIYSVKRNVFRCLESLASAPRWLLLLQKNIRKFLLDLDETGMAYFPHLRKPTPHSGSFIYMHIGCSLTASDCTFEQIRWDPHMHVNEAPVAGALIQRGKEQAFLETCYCDSLKPDTTISFFFFLACVCARRMPRNLVFQTEVIYLNMDYLKNGKGYRA